MENSILLSAPFSPMAAEMTAQKKEARSVQIFIDTTAKMSTDTDDVKNAGYGVLKELYKQLDKASSGKKAFDMDLNNKYRTRQEIQRLLK